MQRRGLIRSLAMKGTIQSIQAEVPLSRLFGYVTTLRTLSSGRAEASLQFERYAPVPLSEAERVLTK